MVLESLVSVDKAERNYKTMFFYGFLFVSIAIILALWIFREQSSMVMVFLVVIACIPLMYNTMKHEESIDMNTEQERTLLREHSKALRFLMFLFFGFIVAFALWFTVLGVLEDYNIISQKTAETLFQTQLTTIGQINSKITGDMTSSVTSGGILTQIFLNNFKVLLFCIFFSFFYGAGAIFILTWNASVIGAAIGTFIREKLVHFGSYFVVVPLALMRYMTHGFFEILAYFIGGLAGGIISIAIIRHHTDNKKFKTVLTDSLDLIILAVIILIIAALIEVYITPSLF